MVNRISDIENVLTQFSRVQDSLASFEGLTKTLENARAYLGEKSSQLNRLEERHKTELAHLNESTGRVDEVVRQVGEAKDECTSLCREVERQRESLKEDLQGIRAQLEQQLGTWKANVLRDVEAMEKGLEERERGINTSVRALSDKLESEVTRLDRAFQERAREIEASASHAIKENTLLVGSATGKLDDLEKKLRESNQENAVMVGSTRERMGGLEARVLELSQEEVRIKERIEKTATELRKSLKASSRTSSRSLWLLFVFVLALVAILMMQNPPFLEGITTALKRVFPP